MAFLSTPKEPTVEEHKENLEKIDKKKSTAVQTGNVKNLGKLALARKNALRMLKQAKKGGYFQEKNEAVAIVNMLNSGIGREGRRRLCKKLNLKWSMYLEAESALIESGTYKIKDAVLKCMDFHVDFHNDDAVTPGRLRESIIDRSNDVMGGSKKVKIPNRKKAKMKKAKRSSFLSRFLGRD